MGIGSTDLIMAAVFAMAPDEDDEDEPAPPGAKAAVWGACPYYSGYGSVGYFKVRLLVSHTHAPPITHTFVARPRPPLPSSPVDQL